MLRWWVRWGYRDVGWSAEIAYLGEADVSALLTEALTAQVEPVLPDQTGSVGADTATDHQKSA